MIDFLVSRIAEFTQVDMIIVDTLQFTFTNPLSLMVYVLIFLFLSCLLILEYAVLITMSSMIYFGKNLTIRSLVNELKCNKISILNIRTLGLFIIFYVMVSVLGIGFDTHLISPLLISKTILNYIYNDKMLTVLLFALWSLLIYLVSKYSLNIHHFFLKQNVEEPAKPNQIFRENRRPIIAIFLVFAFVHYCFMTLNEQVVNELFIDTIVNGLSMDIGEVLFIVMFLVVTFLKGIILTVFSISLTIIYYRHHGIEISTTKNNESKLALIMAILVLVALTTQYYDIGLTDTNKLMVHRAGGLAVFENSYESIEYALDNNYGAVEIDVMFLKDGEIILSHDANLLAKTSLDVNVYDLTLDEIKNIDLINDSGEHFGFISLEEVFKLTNKELFINIELKVHGHEQKEYLHDLVGLIQEYNLEEHVCVSTFEYDDLVKIEAIDPKIKTIVISYYFLGDVSKLKTDGVALDIKYTNSTLVSIFKQYDKSVYVWTANKPVDIANALSMDCDYLITDEPDRVLDVKEVFNELDTKLSVF